MKPRNGLIGLTLGIVAVTGGIVIAQVSHVMERSTPARLDAPPQAASGNPVLTTAAAQPTTVQAEPHTLRVLTSSDPDFNSSLDREYPGLRQLPEFRDLQSKVVLVQNQSSRQIHAFVMKWTTQASGEAPAVAYSPYMKTPKPDHVLTGGVTLAANETILLSPWLTLSKSLHASMKGTNGPQSALAAFLRASVSGPAKDVKLVSGSVDSAVVSDSTIIGPDEAKLLDHFECERNGQHDEGVSIMRALRAKASDQEITDKLNEHIQRGQVLRGNADRESLYRSARATEAQMLLQILQQGGRAKLEKTVAT